MGSDLEQCWECGKPITADEAAVNWMSCYECFDNSVKKYERKYWWKNLWYSILARFRKDPFKDLY